MPLPSSDDWVALSAEPLRLEEIASWVVLPRCGAVVVFSGTVRDRSEGRPGVSALEYEAYGEGALARLRAVAREIRERWPATGRVALVHRTGLLVPTEVSAVAAVSAPHRAEAFEAARFAIDTLKETVPVWKRETWKGGSDWTLDVHPLRDVDVAHLRGSEQGER